jgi:hypothetical protein
MEIVGEKVRKENYLILPNSIPWILTTPFADEDRAEH